MSQKAKMSEHLSKSNDNTQLNCSCKELTAKYEYLINNGPDIIYRLDKDGNITFINNAVENYGYTPDDLIGINILDIVHFEDRSIAKFRINERRKGDRKTKSLEIRLLSKNKKSIPFEIQSTVYKTPVFLLDAEGLYSKKEGGKELFIGSQGIARDITVRKKVEDALKMSEEKYRTLTENTNYVVFSISSEGLVNYISPQVSKYGFEADDIISQPFQNFIYQEDCERVISNFVKSISTGVEFFTEFRIKNNNGVIYWFEEKAKIQRDNLGNITGFIGLLHDITERKNTKLALKQSENRYKQLVDNIPVMSWTTDLKGAALYISPNVENVYGFTQDEIYNCKGKLWFDRIHRDDVARVKEKFYLLMMKNEKYDIEYRVQKKDGNWIWIHDKAVTQYDETKKKYAYGVSSDITARKSAEEALSESESQYRIIYETALVGMFRTRMSDGKILKGNNFVAAFLGYHNVEEMLKDDVKMRSLYSAKRRKELFRLLKEKGEVKAFEIELTRPDDLRMDIVISAKIFPDKDYLEGVIIDVTEHKQAKQALRNSEESYRTLFESAGDAIVILKDDLVIDCNKKTLELFACSYDQVMGKQPYLFFSEHQPEKQDPIKEALEKIQDALNGEPQLFEWQFKRYDDSLFDAEVNFTKIEINGNIHIQAIIRDISERKKAEDVKKKLEDQLHHAKKMESIGRLAGGIAHDFNNILTGIMGYAQVLKKQTKDQSSVIGKAAEVILNGTAKAAHLTEQLLDFAKKGKYDPSPLNVNRVLKESLLVLEKVIDKKITIKFDLEENLKTIEADMNQLDQVFTNLIINARDAMPDGGDLIFKTENFYIDEKVESLYPDLDENHYVILSITDCGSGMPQDIKEKIFEPFFTTKAEGKGTGLGLANVYSIMKHHNGHIKVYSEPGIGTTFILYFPVSRKEISTIKKNAEIIKGDACILIVDDNKSVRSIAEYLLHTLEYRVILANDGLEAIQIYKENYENIDLVLLDMIMPNMAGKETFEELRKTNPDVKVILSSGFSKNGDVESIIRKGGCGFIQKPFRLEELSKLLNEALSNTLPTQS